MALRAAAVFSILMLVGGCAAVEPRPAMAPFGANGEFGYSERDLGDDLREIDYVGAPIAVSSASPGSDSRVAPEQEKVRDLALWRAAEVASSGGFVGFRVEQETRDNDFIVTEELVPRPMWYPMWGYYGPYYRSPWWFGDGYDTFDTRRRARLRAKITLRIKLLHEPLPGDPLYMDAAALNAEIRTKRADATY